MPLRVFKPELSHCTWIVDLFLFANLSYIAKGDEIK